MSHVACAVWTAIVLAAVLSCAPSDRPAARERGGPIELFDGRVIPAMPELLGKRAQCELRLEWLADKHELLLELMRSHWIEMWIVVSEEFHTDPVTRYVAPPLQRFPELETLIEDEYQLDWQRPLFSLYRRRAADD